MDESVMHVGTGAENVCPPDEAVCQLVEWSANSNVGDLRRDLPQALIRRVIMREHVIRN
jgi:hypothetical protein